MQGGSANPGTCHPVPWAGLRGQLGLCFDTAQGTAGAGLHPLLQWALWWAGPWGLRVGVPAGVCHCGLRSRSAHHSLPPPPGLLDAPRSFINQNGYSGNSKLTGCPWDAGGGPVLLAPTWASCSASQTVRN